jgi:hypothetical protein
MQLLLLEYSHVRPVHVLKVESRYVYTTILVLAELFCVVHVQT